LQQLLEKVDVIIDRQGQLAAAPQQRQQQQQQAKTMWSKLSSHVKRWAL
jgi:hypothetical protein